MKAAKLLAAFSIALVSLTACEPTRNTQMYELNGMVFQLLHQTGSGTQPMSHETAVLTIPAWTGPPMAATRTQPICSSATISTLARCGDFSWYAEWACHPDANLYFATVNLAPPYAWPWDAGKQGFAW
jgi:hypothetical protein